MPVPVSNTMSTRAVAFVARLRHRAGGPPLAVLIDRRGNNFDALRLVAALAVLFGHGFVLTAGHQDAATVDLPLSRPERVVSATFPMVSTCMRSLCSRH